MRFTGHALRTIEEKLENIYGSLHSAQGAPKVMEKCRILESHRHSLLLELEETWHLKSCTLWIEAGDQNPKFFHNFTNHRRNKKYYLGA
jgi:hypothetical protein